jgi:hypothetical protein
MVLGTPTKIQSREAAFAGVLLVFGRWGRGRGGLRGMLGQFGHFGRDHSFVDFGGFVRLGCWVTMRHMLEPAKFDRCAILKRELATETTVDD